MSLSPLEALLLFGILGSLAGALAFLFRALSESKDTQISELAIERDYYRHETLEDREFPHVLNPARAGSGASGGSGFSQEIAVRPNGGAAADQPSRFAYYSLAIQGMVSIIVLLGSFWVLESGVDGSSATLAGNAIVFVLGVWLGRGVDLAQDHFTTRR